MTTRVIARLDPRLHAQLGAPCSLRFAGPEPLLDLPGHVRAGSAVRRWNGRLVVVQDDVHALALLDPRDGRVVPLPLPPGADGRRTFGDDLGNKSFKMDLEACVTLPDGRLVALGSGSAPHREQVVVVDGDFEARVVDGRELYKGLRARVEFSGSELNVEGAIIVDGALQLFQRGNGAPRDGLEPVDAWAEVDLDDFVAWLDGGTVPALGRVVQIDLGSVRGVRLGFTDAAALPDGRVAFIACAEDSPDVYQDGAVVGCRFGLIEGGVVRTTDVCDADGAPSPLKLEGIDLLDARDDAWEFLIRRPFGAPACGLFAPRIGASRLCSPLEFVVVADLDDTRAPAVMATLRVTEQGLEHG